MKPVLIFKDTLLPYSETWLLAQAAALQDFSPYYVGLSRTAGGLPLPENRTFSLADGRCTGGRIRSLAYPVTRFDPGFFNDVEQLGPALIHAQFERSGLYAAPLAAKLRLPLITSCYGNDVTRHEVPGLKTSVRRMRRKQLCREGDLFIAISKFIREKMIARGYPEDRTVIHHLGIDLDVTFKEQPRARDSATVLFVGRLVEKKGCEYLIRAAGSLRSAIPDLELVIIGDGPLRGALQVLAAEQAVSAQFLGSLPASEVSKWMARARVFCVPSMTARDGDSEGLGVVFCEAQAMGLPVVSSFHGGIPEVVEHGKTGLLAKERDWQGLAANIHRILAHEALWNEYSAAGKLRVAAYFNLATQTRRLEEMYRKVIASRAESNKKSSKRELTAVVFS